MNICLFTQEEIENPLALKDERAQHLIKILHKKAGDTFTAGIVNGPSGSALITKIAPEGIYFDFKAEGEGKPLYPLKMIIGFPRPIQLKRLLRDIAALGVSEVHLTGTELGEKSYMQSNLLEKGNAYKMLFDGTVQAGGTKIPELFMHQKFEECVEALCKPFDSSDGREPLLLGLDNVRPTCSLGKALASRADQLKERGVVAAIGSERGWTDRERKLFLEKGFELCGMGCRIMRTETAASVAGAIILNEMGVME
ncbi:MAG: RsmE family RNA methyltransferase [Treponema sp.]|nr:RsmE family RNA methyltransferase [Treponema sp.]